MSLGMYVKYKFFRYIVIVTILVFSSSNVGNAENPYPIITGNSSVVFRTHIPNANSVILTGTMLPTTKKIKTPAGTFGKQGKIKMDSIGNGWWEYRIKSISPGLYTYNYKIDDKISQIDSLNPNVMREGNEYMSYFIIKGGYADDYLNKTVPHGQIKEIWYPTTLEGFSKRRLMLYIPKEYSTNRTKHYPVLYLLHGSGGDEEAWLDCGRLAQIMDNLIAEKRCKPMLVVMPNGIANKVAAPGKDPERRDLKASSINVESMVGEIESVFIKDIVHYIDKNYRTIKSKDARAIAGLSLGGLQTIYISLNNPTYFDYIGLFSAQATNAVNNKNIGKFEDFSDSWNQLSSLLPFLKKKGIGKKITEITNSMAKGSLDVYSSIDEKLAIQFADPPKLYYITLGSDDFVKKLNDDFRKKLDKGNYKYVYIETDGGHTWDNWRKYLVDFLPRLF